jgi:hypothetical protein
MHCLFKLFLHIVSIKIFFISVRGHFSLKKIVCYDRKISAYKFRFKQDHTLVKTTKLVVECCTKHPIRSELSLPESEAARRGSFGTTEVR